MIHTVCVLSSCVLFNSVFLVSSSVPVMGHVLVLNWTGVDGGTGLVCLAPCSVVHLNND